jgi:hypothetical protein
MKEHHMSGWHEQVRHLVQLATLAPSVHNTQPWRFVELADGIDVLPDPSRQLDVLDPVGRLMHLSCGAVVHHLRIGARGMGLDAAVELLPDGPTGERVAHLALTSGEPPTAAELALAEALLRRHTYRGRFDDRPVGDAVLALLQVTAEQEGAALTQVTGTDDQVRLEVLLDRADAAERSSEAYVAELALWVRDDVSNGDGIPTSAVGSAQQRTSSVKLREFLPGQVPVSAPGMPAPAEQPALVVLLTEQDDRRSWLQAGQALGAVLVQAADLGVVAQPLGQATDFEGFRTRLATELHLVGSPQLVLRLGYAQAPAETPRRPVEDVLVAG